MLSRAQIQRFYLQWAPSEAHRSWPGLWCKQFKVRTCGDVFVSLNKIRPRLGFGSLRRLCLELAPANVYMSALSWLMPERVADKRASTGAYPVGGEYVVDVDSYLDHRPHAHRLTEEGVCEGCLLDSKRLAERLLDEIEENYSNIKIVFSGKSGFHIHVLDFEVRDWALYREKNPLKSHEVARFRYTMHLSEVVGGFDRHHFIVSSDVMRVITFPESLNASTGLICSCLGSPHEFRDTTISLVLRRSRSARGVVSGASWVSMDQLDVHPEPLTRGR